MLRSALKVDLFLLSEYKVCYNCNVINMKNRNGFTLVELLVTIALIGTLSVVVGVSVGNLITNQKYRSYDDFVQDLEEAACVFVQNDNRTSELCQAYNSLCQVKLADLIKNGLIKKTMENPMTEKSVEEDTLSYVQVTYSDGERFCHFVDRDCTDEYCVNREK